MSAVRGGVERGRRLLNEGVYFINYSRHGRRSLAVRDKDKPKSVDEQVLLTSVSLYNYLVLFLSV